MEEEDRISGLPNPILYQIITSLQTKDAAATSILSKRWNQLWLSLLSLQFIDQTVFNPPSSKLRIAKFLDSKLIWTYNPISSIPTLNNVTQLEFIFKSETWRSRWNWAVQVIQHCPNLDSLKIDDEACKYEQAIADEGWREPELVPACLSRLTECKLRGYKGFQGEFEFAKFVLLKAKLLRTLKIKSSCLDEVAKYEIGKRLGSYYCLWASNTCNITYKFPFDGEYRRI